MGRFCEHVFRTCLHQELDQTTEHQDCLLSQPLSPLNILLASFFLRRWWYIARPKPGQWRLTKLPGNAAGLYSPSLHPLPALTLPCLGCEKWEITIEGIPYGSRAAASAMVMSRLGKIGAMFVACEYVGFELLKFKLSIHYRPQKLGIYFWPTRLSHEIWEQRRKPHSARQEKEAMIQEGFGSPLARCCV